MITDDIDIGIITAPRLLPTLDLSVKSIRKVLPEVHLTIFAEPGKLELDAQNITVLVNTEKLGGIKNNHNALEYMYKHGTKKYIWISEDDYFYNSTLKTRLEEVISYEPEFGYFNLFTYCDNPILGQQTDQGWLRLDLGWNDAWGSDYIYRRETVGKIINNDYYKETIKKYENNIDACISETLKRMDMAMFYHNPSPCCSIGIMSTLGNSCRTNGLNYKMDASI